MKILVGAVLASFMVCGSASAQSTEADISARLMGKPLLLRGFWMDDKLKFDGSGSPEKLYKTGSFTTSAFTPTKVSLGGDHLKIEGIRTILKLQFRTVERVQIMKSLPRGGDPEKVTIEVDGHGNRDFTKALDAIFAESLSDLIPSLPEYWQNYANQHFANVPTQKLPTARSYAQAKVGGDVTPPIVLKSVDPQYSDAAKYLKYSGAVLMELDIEKDGTPSHVSILQALGAGLDEQAVTAIRQYRFTPATRAGEPVVVYLSLGVNFQIF